LYFGDKVVGVFVRFLPCLHFLSSEQPMLEAPQRLELVLRRIPPGALALTRDTAA
jgi:hypothetical protein